jgi:Tfp pilus assembly protein PilF
MVDKAPRPAEEAVPAARGAAQEMARDARKLVTKMQYSEAAALLARCLDVDPHYSDCRVLYASVLAQLGQKDRAREHYRQIYRNAPTDVRRDRPRELNNYEGSVAPQAP